MAAPAPTLYQKRRFADNPPAEFPLAAVIVPGTQDTLDVRFTVGQVVEEARAFSWRVVTANATVTLADLENGILCEKDGGTLTVTVPALDVQVACSVVVVNRGTAIVTVVGAGATVQHRDIFSATLGGQHAAATLLWVAEDTWNLSGDLELA